MEEEVDEGDDRSASPEVQSREEEELDRLEMRAKARQIEGDDSATSEYLDALRGAGRGPGAAARLSRALREVAESRPLSESEWSECISGVEDSDEVVSLCRRALDDCGMACVDVWVVLWSSSQAERQSGVVEEALVVAGLDPEDGGKLWELLRREVAEDQQRVLEVFRRELATPLLSLEGVVKEFEEWSEARGVGEEKRKEVREAAKVGREKMEARVGFEEVLAKKEGVEVDEEPRLKYWKRYVEFERSEGETSRVRCLYERALRRLGSSAELWKLYASDDALDAQGRCAVLERAVRHCPGSGTIWAAMFGALESAGRDEVAVEEAIGKAKEAVGKSATDSSAVLEAAFGFRIRRLRYAAAVMGKDKVEEVKAEFRRLCGADLEWAKGGGNAREWRVAASSYEQAWAHAEEMVVGDPVMSSTLWEQATRTCPSSVGAWLGCMEIEARASACGAEGRADKCRGAAKKALQLLGNLEEVQSVADSWRRFEREQGSLQLWQAADKECEERLTALRVKRQNITEKAEAGRRAAEARAGGSQPPHKRQRTEPVHRGGGQRGRGGFRGRGSNSYRGGRGAERAPAAPPHAAGERRRPKLELGDATGGTHPPSAIPTTFAMPRILRDKN